MVPMLRERYLADRNARFVALLTDPKKSETERFWNALEKMEHERKVLRRCLDGHSRSSMHQYIMIMIHCGMLREGDMNEFSKEMQDEVSYAFEKTKK